MRLCRRAQLTVSSCLFWPAAKTYSWCLPKLEPAVEVCVRLHAGTYVRMSMVVGWPKGNSLVCLHKCPHWYVLPHMLMYSNLLHNFPSFLCENSGGKWHNNVLRMFFVYMHSEVFLMCNTFIHTVPVYMQVIPSNRPAADKLLIHDFFSSWLQTS